MHSNGPDIDFYIFDESCTIGGRYPLPPCDTPFIIEDNFLKYVLTVNIVDTEAVSPYLSFNYGARKYSIRNNHCVCNNEGSFFEAVEACRCAFPVDG